MEEKALNTEKRRTRQHLKDMSDMTEEKTGCAFGNVSKTEENSTEMSTPETTAMMADDMFSLLTVRLQKPKM